MAAPQRIDTFHTFVHSLDLMSYKKILLAAALQRYVNFTPLALRQREFALALAQKFGAELHVLTAQAPAGLLPHVESTEEKLARYVEPLQDQDVTVKVIYRVGKPSTVIQQVVSEMGADLVIIGSHSKRGVLDVGIGSTAAAVERGLAATVMMIRPTVEDSAKAREEMIPKYPLVFPYG